MKREALRKGDEADRNAERQAEDTACEERMATAYREAEAEAIEAANREEFARLRRAPWREGRQRRVRGQAGAEADGSPGEGRRPF